MAVVIGNAEWIYGVLCRKWPAGKSEFDAASESEYFNKAQAKLADVASG